MRADRDPDAAGPRVSGFAGDRVKIDGTARPGGVLLTPERAEDWVAGSLAEVDLAALSPLLALDPAPEIILLGTGRATVMPDAALRASLEARGIGLEPMDSRAAARLWGLLRGEGRWIAAALLPLG